MDKISKLLEETQNLLEGFSSGTLSPVSSYYNSGEEEEEETEEDETEEVESEEEERVDPEDDEEDLEFRNTLRSGENYKILKFIENITAKIHSKALHICVEERCKDLEVFKALLRRGCDPLEPNSEGQTALNLLLEQKEEDSQQSQGRTTFFEVEETNCLISTLLGEWELRRAATRDVNIFKWIHSRNWKEFFKFLEQQEQPQAIKILTRPDPRFAGISPLHEIAAMNETECFRKLLTRYKNFMDLNVKAIGSGNTLLHEAAHMSSTEMVRLLIESGARCDIKNATGRIPAHLGTEQIQVIFEFNTLSRSSSEGTLTEEDGTGRDFKKQSTDSLSREERKLKQIIGILDRIESVDGISEENVKRVKRSSSEDGDVSQRDSRYTHSNHLSSSNHSSSDHSHKNEDISVILQRENHTGRTVLHRYARRNQSERLFEFIKKYERECRKYKLFELVDNSGNTPLHEAASEGSFESVKLILFGGKTAKVKNLRIDPSIPAAFTGDTPLHAAALTGNSEIVELLLNVGADRTARNIEGKRAIDVTRSKSVRKLLESEEEEKKTVDLVDKVHKMKKQKQIIPLLDDSLVPVKRGPGRPRKYPRPDETSTTTSVSTSTSKALKPTHSQSHAQAHSQSQSHAQPFSLPENLNCVILIKFDRDWLLLSDHFLNIFAHLCRETQRPAESVDYKNLFIPAGPADKFLISKLPRTGNLIELLLKDDALNKPLFFVKKTDAVQFFEKEFNYNFSGPFGYIDVVKLLDGKESQSQPAYRACPIKLKMKIIKSTNNCTNSSNLCVNNDWILPEPKSPKSFSM